MNLWLVLSIAGEIAGTWGPLPYDHNECLRRASEATIEARERHVAYEGPPLGGPLGRARSDEIRFSCRFSGTRPPLALP